MSFDADDIERAIREKEQQEQLREEILKQALIDWLSDPEHNYSRIANKYHINRMTFYNYVQRLRRQKGDKDAKDTETSLRAITLQQP